MKEENLSFIEENHYILKLKEEAGAVAHAFNSRTQKAEVGEFL